MVEKCNGIISGSCRNNCQTLLELKKLTGLDFSLVEKISNDALDSINDVLLEHLVNGNSPETKIVASQLVNKLQKKRPEILQKILTKTN
ncbi:MAG: hypothetical protein Q7K11_00945 [Candidatus Berkelbacteria bacterium]|nr:hypothetical protein [Candidatus Berkelbacteria bacterium]